MPTSPNPLNYYVGKGIVKWKGISPITDSDFRDIGNVPLFELTPQVQRLPHFSSRRGTKFQDFNIVLSQLATVKFHLEEWTPENLTLFLMGTQNAGVSGSSAEIDIMNVNQVTGFLRFVGTNSVGDMEQVDLPDVSIAPSAGISVIGDTWGVLEITGEVFANVSTGSFGQLYTAIIAEVDP